MNGAPQRFASVDALRGITVAAMLLVNNPGDWGHVYAPPLHADWHGCTPTDLIFPFFLFVVGVSIALGIVPRAEAARTRVRCSVASWCVLKIIAIGCCCMRWRCGCSTGPCSGRWACCSASACFLVAAPLALHLAAPAVVADRGDPAGLLGITAAGGTYAPGENLANSFDTALLGRFQYIFDPATGFGQNRKAC